jgi:hypothetical protein
MANSNSPSPVNTPIPSFDSSEIRLLKSWFPENLPPSPSPIGPAILVSENRSEGESRLRSVDEVGEAGTSSLPTEINREYDDTIFISAANAQRYADSYQFCDIISGLWVNYKDFEIYQDSLLWLPLFKSQGWEEF